MTAPAAHFAMLHIDNIVESQTNPRKHFGNLEELAASIREKGVLSPVKARLVNGHFELVYGARRLRAAKSVGLKEIPALVQEMTDKDVLEEQIIENAQRDDVPPLEEAEGYRALIEKHGYTADDIAAKVGKSKRVIYERIQLCKLGKEGRAALSEERMNASVALLVARIPGELQVQAVKDLAARDDDDMPLSYRRAVEHVQRNFMLQLKDAPFSLTDQTLVMKAGACSACPKRTGNQPELFADVKAKDVCTDPKCYRSKEDALWQLKVKDAEKNGQKVIEGKAAEKLFHYGGEQLTGGSGYVELNGQEWVGQKMRTIKSILGKSIPATTFIRGPTGKVIEVVPRDVVQQKVREIEPEHGKRPGNASMDSYRKQQAEQARKQKLRAKVVDAAIPLLVDKAEQDAKGAFLDFLAEAMLHHSFSDGVRRAVARRGLSKDGQHPDDQFRKELKRGLTDKGLRGWIAEVVAGDNATGGSWDTRYGVRFEEACKLFGINLKKLEETEKAKAKAKKPAPAKKGGKK